MQRTVTTPRQAKAALNQKPPRGNAHQRAAAEALQSIAAKENSGALRNRVREVMQDNLGGVDVERLRVQWKERLAEVRNLGRRAKNAKQEREAAEDVLQRAHANQSVGADEPRRLNAAAHLAAKLQREAEVRSQVQVGRKALKAAEDTYYGAVNEEA